MQKKLKDRLKADLLLVGPDLLKSLIGMHMRFRQSIKIKIQPDDRDAQRFIWRRENRSIEPQEFVIISLLFGAKTFPFIALFIKNENMKRYSSQCPRATNNIKTFFVWMII